MYDCMSKKSPQDAHLPAQSSSMEKEMKREILQSSMCNPGRGIVARTNVSMS